jgi:hypothetical protein
MKKLFTFFCVLYCLKGFAVDPGFAYRFHVNITLENGKQYSGYVYKYSYNKVEEDNKFTILSEHAKGEITVYPHIITVNAGMYNLDFVLEGAKQQVKLAEITQIRITETLDFIVAERVKELSEEQYRLIQSTKPEYEIIQEAELLENLHYILFTWNKNQQLLVKKNTLAKEILEKWKLLIKVEIPNSKTYNDYIKKLKENLLKESILLIDFHDAL